MHAGAPRGKIRLQTEEVADSKFSIVLQLSANKLDKKDFFGKVSEYIQRHPQHHVMVISCFGSVYSYCPKI